MSTKEKNNRKKLKKYKNTLAAVCVTGLVSSTLTVANVSASEINTVDLIDNIILSEKSNDQADINFPTVEEKNIRFDKAKKENLVIDGVECFDKTIEKFTIMDGNDLKVIKADDIIYNKTDKTITILCEKIIGLDLSVGGKPCGLIFSDGTTYVGQIRLEVVDGNTSAGNTGNNNSGNNNVDINTSSSAVEVPNFVPTKVKINELTINEKK